MSTPQYPASDICVIYLARAAEGLRPWKAFLESYARCPGGMPHDLLVVFKGFSSSAALREYAAIGEGLRYEAIHLRDYGYDITSYRRAADHLHGRYVFLCLLNTHTILLDGQWLQKMYAWAVRPGVGAVGATGSYESGYTNFLLKYRRYEGPYPKMLVSLRRWWLKRRFPPFPNPHLRTNGLILRSDLFRKVWPTLILTKNAAYDFESGWKSLTRRIAALGLQVLVVGRDGQSYHTPDWPMSGTFRLGQQSNLLIGDNQTRVYHSANEVLRGSLSKLAWGADRLSDIRGSADTSVALAVPRLEDV